MTLTVYTSIFCLIVAITPILGPLFGRDNIRRFREEVITQFNDKIGGNGIQACEFVKYKYQNRHNTIFDILYSILYAFPLFVILYTFSYFCVLLSFGYFDQVFPYIISISMRDPFLYWIMQYTKTPFSWVILVGFCAAYINMWSDYLRALRNYEFNHLDYIDSAINILLSIFIGLVFFSAYHIFVEIIPFHKEFNPSVNSRLYISIFVVIAAAYYPDIIKRYIVNFSRMNYVKVEKSERFNSLEIIPVEVIDGIDTGIRKRLEDYHIVSVQNLATANPVMLFVETPFVIYELVDWVAQAQLITALGINKTTKLWDFGIRTILDLEFHVRNNNTDPLIYQALSSIVLPDSAIVKATNSQSPGALTQCVNSMMENPHVMRLGQLVDALKGNLRHKNQFNPISGSYSFTI